MIKEFSIIHNKEGFEELERYLTPEMKIGLETTGVYCKIIYKHLKQKYDVHYVDNVQMQKFARLHSPSIKNDVVDARLIAKFLLYDFKKIDPIRVDELKDMTQLHQKLINQRATYKKMLRAQTNVIFPELETISSLSNAKGMQTLILQYPSPRAILNASTQEIENALLEKIKFRGRYNQTYIKKIQELAKTSVGVKDYPTTCYQYTARVLLFYQDLCDELADKMLIKLMETPYYPLLDKWGYDITSVAKIVGEVGDIRRFKNHKKFVGYCGLGITEKQSGNSTSRNTHITRAGDKILRSTFYALALGNIRYKKGLYPFFQRLKEKGKHPKKAVTACARKLGVWTYYEMKKCHEVNNEQQRTKNTNGNISGPQTTQETP